MSQNQDTIVTALMEQLIAEGPDGMAQVFTALFNLALRLEREGGHNRVPRDLYRRLSRLSIQTDSTPRVLLP